MWSSACGRLITCLIQGIQKVTKTSQAQSTSSLSIQIFFWCLIIWAKNVAEHTDCCATDLLEALEASPSAVFWQKVRYDLNLMRWTVQRRIMMEEFRKVSVEFLILFVQQKYWKKKLKIIARIRANGNHNSRPQTFAQQFWETAPSCWELAPRSCLHTLYDARVSLA